MNQTLAVGSALFLVGMPAWLKIKRKIGPVTTLLIALCFFALSHALIGVLIWEQQADSAANYAPAMMLISRIFYGIGASAIVPVVQAWASSKANSDTRLQLLQKISAHLILGRIIGPVLSLPLIWIWPPLTIILVLFLAFHVGISLCKLRKDDHRVSEDVSQLCRQKHTLRILIGSLGPYLTLAASLQILVGIVQFSFSIWLMETFQWGAENVAIFTGCLLMSCGLLVAVAQLYIKPPTQAFSSVLRGLTFLLPPISLALLVLPSIGLFSAFNVLVVVTAALWAPTYLHVAIERTEYIRSDSIGTVLAMTHTIAYSLTGMLSGYLYQWNRNNVFFIAAMMSIVAFYIGHQILVSFTQSVNK